MLRAFPFAPRRLPVSTSAQDPFKPGFDLLLQGRMADGANHIAAVASQAVMAGRRDLAEQALRAAVRLAPQQAVLLARLAGVRQMAGDPGEAQTLAQRALQLDEGETMAATLRVEHLVERGQASEAIAVAEACLRHQPEAPQLRRAYSQALLIQGRSTLSAAAALRVAEQLPNNPAAISTAAMALLYDDSRDARQLAAQHRALVRRMPPDPAGAVLAPRPPLAGRPLRVGFVSGDFRAHPVGFFIATLFQHLDRERFLVHAYSRVGAIDQDEFTAQLRTRADRWHDTAALNDAQVHALIQREGIDVLIDLAGLTFGGRPRLFAARAAPVQLAYLGYPYSSGLPNIDGLIGDVHVLPPEADALYAERLYRLPHAFLSLAGLEDTVPVSPLPSLRAGHFTFGSLNHLAKVSDRTVALWARVLQQVRHSRLALCAIAFLDPGTQALTAQRFADHGIEAERLLLLSPRTPLGEFLRYYDQIDLGLDPLPFNGGTTTVQALWAGVPTLTLPGESMMNRMGLSIARTAGLGDGFIARDADHYVELAASWAQRREELATLRAGLRAQARATTLFDGARFAREFGELLSQIVTP